MNQYKTNISEATLSANALVDRRNRIKQIIEKIQNGIPFELKGGGEVVLDKSNIPRFEELLKGKLTKPEVYAVFGKMPMLRLEDGTDIKITALQKTKDIGGKESEEHLSKELKALGNLDTLIREALEYLQQESMVVHFVDHKDNNLLTVENVSGIIKQEKLKDSELKGTDPKSDFFLTDKSGKGLAYISHKDGTTPKDFGQWSGTSWKSGKKIETHKEVLKFAEDIKQTKYVTERDGLYYFQRKITIGRRIESMELKLMSIFGEQYNKDGVSGPQNVDIICQGTFKLEYNDDNSINISCDHMMGRKAFISDFDYGYEPVLITRYGGGRASGGIVGARMLIYPISGRAIADFI